MWLFADVQVLGLGWILSTFLDGYKQFIMWVRSCCLVQHLCWTYSSSSGFRVVGISSGSGLGVVVVEVVVEVLEEGLRMFLNLDLRLKDLGLVGAALVVVGWVVNLSLLLPNSRVLDLNRDETGFLEKDLEVVLGSGVVEVEGASSEDGFL